MGFVDTGFVDTGFFIDVGFVTWWSNVRLCECVCLCVSARVCMCVCVLRVCVLEG